VKISKRVRARVVELLRCAADFDFNFHRVGLATAYVLLGGPACFLAARAGIIADARLALAYVQTYSPELGTESDRSRWELLEAALVVEKTLWPVTVTAARRMIDKRKRKRSRP
jgi:hypothetical protein